MIVRRSAALVILCTLAAAAPALAQGRVGVAGPVQGHAVAIMPDGTSHDLAAGQDVVLNEKIVTDPGAQAEIIFLDRSSLRVGPDSEMTIDDFAYSPQDASGKLSASAMKGLVRFTGGDLSKSENQVTVRTPSAILGVRGGIALADVGAGGTQVTFLYGNALSVTGTGGASLQITEPGYFSTIGNNGAPTPPQLWNAGALAALLSRLSNSGGVNGGSFAQGGGNRHFTGGGSNFAEVIAAINASLAQGNAGSQGAQLNAPDLITSGTPSSGGGGGGGGIHPHH